MRSGEPSRTALRAGVRRAAHQLLEGGSVFPDALAVPILGMTPTEILHGQASEAFHFRRGHRLSLAARSRFAENRLLVGVQQRDVRQYLILGAGLDTFGYRNPFGARLHVFETDHPDTQIWKKGLVKAAKIEVPSWLSYVSIDLETDNLAGSFSQAGFDFHRRTFVSCLGLLAYLKAETIAATFKNLAALPGGCEIVFDAFEPLESLNDRDRLDFETRSAKVADFGEPWLSAFDASYLQTLLKDQGFHMVLCLNPQQIARRFYPALGHLSPVRGVHLFHAWTV